MKNEFYSYLFSNKDMNQSVGATVLPANHQCDFDMVEIFTESVSYTCKTCGSFQMLSYASLYPSMMRTYNLDFNSIELNDTDDESAG